MANLQNSITDIPGIRVGHADNQAALTGCTVILCEGGAMGGVDQRGGAPGTRETDLLRPMHTVENVHAIMLAGGSAFGLDAASGAMRYLSEKGVGFNTGFGRVPIVPAAIIFDLDIGDPNIRPDAEMGYQACLNASTEPPANGSVGVGTGATVGKILGPTQVMRSGVGTASMEISNGVIVAAIMAVNTWGDVIDPETNQIVAGARPINKGPVKIGGSEKFADTLQVMRSFVGRTVLGFASRQNTAIGVVATNAKLTKEEANKLAQMAQNGVARTIRPAHTMYDGDTIFALATGKARMDVNIVGAFAPLVVSQAILRAVRSATPTETVPAASNY